MADVALPGGAVSARVAFVAKATADPRSDVDVSFDVLILRHPSAVIFADGFESGDASAWSGITGQ